MIMYIHQDKIDQLDILDIAEKFIAHSYTYEVVVLAAPCIFFLLVAERPGSPSHRWNHGGRVGTCPHSLATMGAVPPF